MFELLGIGGESDESDFEELLRKSISEGDEFLKWSKSIDPLRKIRFFHKIDGRLIPARPLSDFSCEDFFGIVVRIEMEEGSQFEIWECQANLEPKFPVYRVPFSKVCGVKESTIIERLRDDVSLILKLIASGNTVDFKVAFDLNPSFATSGMSNGHLETVEKTVKTEGRKEAVSVRIRSVARYFISRLNSWGKVLTDHSNSERQDWYRTDVRTEKIYRLGDMFRPAIMAI
jgi:hypothetical protein